MKPLALLTSVLLSLGIVACAAGKGASSQSHSASVPTTTSTAATSTGTTSTGTAAKAGSENAANYAIYGHEASAADKRAITVLVNSYYAAAAADDGAKACSLIYSLFAEAIPEDYGQPPGPPELRGKTCAAVMAKLFKHVPGQPSAVLAKTKVTAVRVKGRNGYALLRSSRMPRGYIQVERELGAWKIGSLIGGECQTCSSD
jgi:hypothetical protein